MELNFNLFMKVNAYIPARMKSSRFPGKPLIDLLGKPMIQHVWEKTKACKDIDEVLSKYKKKIHSLFHFGEFSRIYQSFKRFNYCFK